MVAIFKLVGIGWRTAGQAHWRHQGGHEVAVCRSSLCRCFLGLLLNEVGMGKHADFMGFEWNFKWFQGDVNRNLMGFNG
jgi:hypothetical protein